MRYTMIAVAVAGLFAGAAMAEIQPIGDPVEGDSWTQRFQESGVGQFDYLQVRMLPDDQFVTPGAQSAFSVAGWTEACTNRFVSVATGPSVDLLQWDVTFDELQSEPLTFHFTAYSGGTLVEGAIATWDGSGWDFVADPIGDPRLLEGGLILQPDGECYAPGDTITYCAFTTCIGAQWNHKMHFPQLPDPNGWDVNATVPLVLADDWECSETGPVEDIHFWGSWMGDMIGEIISVRISIHEDIPDPDGEGPLFSMPGVLLWEREFLAGEFDVTPVDPPASQGWFDPDTGEFIELDHEQYFRYDITDIPEPFFQEEGTIYWLDISVTTDGPLWGWKTSTEHFNDDGVWGILPLGDPWSELRDPITNESLDMAFVITAGPDEIVGGQFFLEFDDTALSFVSADPGDDGTDPANPFEIEVFENVVGNQIDYAVGVPTPPGIGTDQAVCMAFFTFTVEDEPCTVDDLLTFRSSTPPTQLTNANGDAIFPTLIDWVPVTLDGTPPDIIPPADLTFECDEFGPFNHKMHRPQYPNPEGWDVWAHEPLVLADDWLCIESGPILDIHFWGSWQGDIIGDLLEVRLSIHENIWDPDGPGPLFSMPGPMLWDETFGGADVNVFPVDPPSLQGWLEPPDIAFPNDHEQYFRYDITGIPEPFVQEQGQIYWLDLQVISEPPFWGWKTALGQWADDAVWGLVPDPMWEELRDPLTLESLDMAFVITAGPHDPPDFGDADITDNCDPNPTVTVDVVENLNPCDGTGTITRTWTATDFCGNVSTATQTITVVDTTPPVVACPPDVSVNADPGGCTATFHPGFAVAGDNCDPNPMLSWQRSDGAANLDDPFDAANSPITITWMATDCAGNVGQCVQTITVLDKNELVIDLEVEGLLNAVTRCITFVFTGTDGPVTIEQDVAFDSTGSADDVSLLVDCGDYDCVLVRDKLHTLQRAESLTVGGGIYSADLTGTRKLVAANFNDDLFIDILDFGTFVGQYNVNYGTGDTPCGTAPPNVDLEGDGVITGSYEFSFISGNFLEASETSCGPLLARDSDHHTGTTPPARPVTRISVNELIRRGLFDLVKADLNGDGWLDEQDMEAFMHGVRP